MLRFNFSISGKIIETSINSIVSITDMFPISVDLMPHVNKLLGELKTRDDAMTKAKFGYLAAHKACNGDVTFTAEIEDEFVIDVLNMSTRGSKSFAPLISAAAAFFAVAKVTIASSSKKIAAMGESLSKKWFEDEPKTKAKTDDPDPETSTDVPETSASADEPEAKSDASEADKDPQRFYEYGIGVIDEEINGERMISVQVFRQYRNGKSVGLTCVHNYGDIILTHYTSLEDERYTRMQANGQIEWKFDDLTAAKVAMYDRYAELTASNNKADEDDSVEEESVED